MLRRSTSRFSHDDEDHSPYQTYRPLSRLPTPPPCYKDKPTDVCPAISGQPLKPSLLGPATHLVNLIPISASLTLPSIPLTQAILTRLSLPLETIALAVCILDSLNSKFALHWRLTIPLTQPTLNKRHTLPLTSQTPTTPPPPLHIDSLNPTLIALAALSISIKFTDDPSMTSAHFISAYGHGLWTAEQLNVTERCIMENLGYRIMPLYDENLLAEAMVDMQLAAMPPYQTPQDPSPAQPERRATVNHGDGWMGPVAVPVKVE